MLIPDISPITYALLFLVGLVAGLVDSVAGGGGLIALPALLFAGLPPQLALGTNKLQGSFGTLSAAANFIAKGHVSLRDCWQGIIFTLVGACLGALLVQTLDPAFIRPLIPVLLLGVFIYTLKSPELGLEDHAPRLTRTPFYLMTGLGLGFYDGFFGPGTGSFWTVAFMLLLGYNMTRATGVTKVMNFTSNVVALGMFILGGNVCYSVGLTMAVGQVIGGRIGSGLAMRKGAKFIRPVFLTVVFCTILSLVYRQLF